MRAIQGFSLMWPNGYKSQGSQHGQYYQDFCGEMPQELSVRKFDQIKLKIRKFEQLEQMEKESRRAAQVCFDY